MSTTDIGDHDHHRSPDLVDIGAATAGDGTLVVVSVDPDASDVVLLRLFEEQDQDDEGTMHASGMVVLNAGEARGLASALEHAAEHACPLCGLHGAEADE
jgi:hypothetical protein